ncbi:hypothetical protein EBZ70_10725, partial [bacterium]|nr:hypothetical protein [bacterium]
MGRLDSGILSQVSFTGSSVTASGERVGGVAGEFNGTLSQSVSTATVSAGSSYVGGLVGLFYSGSLSQSSATGSVTSTGGQQVGGLVGQYNVGGGTISDSFATGSVSAESGGGYFAGGLVGYLSQGAITRAYATGNVSAQYHYVGGLVGYADGNSGDISSVYATGNVTSTAGERVGGLIGHSERTVSSALATGNVTAASHFVGGLIGASYRNVTAAQSTGTVTATGTDRRYVGGGSYTVSDSSHIGGAVSGGNSYVGGLIGKVNGSAVIGSYANTSVTGAGDFVGGLIGWTSGSVTGRTTATLAYNPQAQSNDLDFGSTFSYASGTVTGRNDVGGLIGRADTNATITNAYYGGPGGTGSVSAERNYGGLIGFLTPGATVTNSHYNIDALTLRGFTSADQTNRSLVAGPGIATGTFSAITIGGLFNDAPTGGGSGQFNRWFNSGALNGLTGTSAADAYFGAASGGAYQLSSVQNLRDYLGFADQSGLTFKLGANIDLASQAGLYVPYLAGNFNGNGFSVTGLALNQHTSNLGLFGAIRGSAVVGLNVSGSVTGLNNVAVAAGSLWQGRLSGTTASGTAQGRDITNYSTDCCYQNNSDAYGYANVGGVVGFASAAGFSNLLIDSATSSVAVTGASNNAGARASQIGGLIGRVINGSVQNASTSGSVSGTTNVGGLIGRLYYGNVSGSTTTGSVSGVGSNALGSERTGGLVGWLEHGASTITTSSHTGGLVSGVFEVGGLVGRSEGVIDGSPAQGSTAKNVFATSDVQATGNRIGGLVGWATGGYISNVYASGTVNTADQRVDRTGGLVGESSVGIYNSYYSGPTVYGGTNSGGLVGLSDNVVSSSYSTGQMAGNSTWSGGLVGNNQGDIYNSYATGNVTGGYGTGGLTGYNNRTISASYATGNVTSYSERVGGLVGQNDGTITNQSYASNSVDGVHYVGGLVGLNYGAISNTYAITRTVGSGIQTGGLVGGLHGGSVSDSWVSGSVQGGYEVGGFVGHSYQNITRGSTSATVSARPGSTLDRAGGFVGIQEGGTITLSRATGSVQGREVVGGFVGYEYSGGTIDRSYATGAVTASGNYAGGFAGYLETNFSGTISNSYAMGSVNGTATSGTSYLGGFVGYAQRGTLTNLYSTGYVSGGAGNVAGAFFGGGNFNQTNGSPAPGSVVASNLYFDSTTSGFATNQTTAATNTANNTSITPTVASALNTANLQGALPTGFASATFTATGATNVLGVWATGTGLYPYLREMFGGPLVLGTGTGAFNQSPQAISGTVTLAGGAVAASAQVGLYASGALLNGGFSSTGANGYYYTLVGASTLGGSAGPFGNSTLGIGASTRIGANLRLAGTASNDVGGRYTDLPDLTSITTGNLTGFDLTEGIYRARTSATSLTSL